MECCRDPSTTCRKVRGTSVGMTVLGVRGKWRVLSRLRRFVDFLFGTHGLRRGLTYFAPPAQGCEGLRLHRILDGDSQQRRWHKSQALPNQVKRPEDRPAEEAQADPRWPPEGVRYKAKTERRQRGRPKGRRLHKTEALFCEGGVVRLGDLGMLLKIVVVAIGEVRTVVGATAFFAGEGGAGDE